MVDYYIMYLVLFNRVTKVVCQLGKDLADIHEYEALRRSVSNARGELMNAQLDAENFSQKLKEMQKRENSALWKSFLPE